MAFGTPAVVAHRDEEFRPCPAHMDLDAPAGAPGFGNRIRLFFTRLTRICCTWTSSTYSDSGGSSGKTEICSRFFYFKFK